MRFFITMILLASISTFSGCSPCTSKKVACNGFDDPAFDAWFPYAAGNRLVFSNLTTGDTIGYTISSAYATAPYETASGGYNGATFCSANKEIRSENTGSTNGYVDIYCNVNKFFNDGPVEISIKITLLGSNWQAGAATANEITAGAGATVITTNNNVNFENGRSYPLLTTMVNDTSVNKASRVYKIFVAKNAGIVGFETFPDRQKWVIQ